MKKSLGISQNGYLILFFFIYSYGSKTALAWIYLCLFLLVISCIIYVAVGIFIIEYIDTLTELYEK